MAKVGWSNGRKKRGGKIFISHFPGKDSVLLSHDLPNSASNSSAVLLSSLWVLLYFLTYVSKSLGPRTISAIQAIMGLEEFLLLKISKCNTFCDRYSVVVFALPYAGIVPWVGNLGLLMLHVAVALSPFLLVHSTAILGFSQLSTPDRHQ